MLLRAEPHWKMIEPLKNIGYRIKRSFFLVNCETEVVGKQILTWVNLKYLYTYHNMFRESFVICWTYLLLDTASMSNLL